MCPGYRKCAQNFMCPGSRNVPEILSYTALGKVKEMSMPQTRNVNFPAHLMGLPYPGNLGFLPVIYMLQLPTTQPCIMPMNYICKTSQGIIYIDHNV